MTSKFGGLAANVTVPSRMTIIYPVTGKPIVDETGKEAYIDLMSQDSAAGRQLAKDRAAEQVKRIAKSGNADDMDDVVGEQIETLAVLTAGWRLVDPVTKKPIEFPFAGEASARELFSAPELQWLRRAAYMHVVNTGNFMSALPAS